MARVYHALPANEQARVAILTSNYGEAAALDVLGTKDGLPAALSGQNQYFLWGPHGHDGSIVILTGRIADQLRGRCQSASTVASFGDRYAMPYERNQSVVLCRDLQPSLQAVWPTLEQIR